MRGPAYARTSPKRRPVSQSARSAAISSVVRATKFHHIRTVSPKGAPPISRHKTAQARDGQLQAGMEKGASETMDRLAEYVRAMS